MDYGNGLMVVTGASSGIGAAIAVELAQRGARLLLTGRNAERLDGVARSLRTPAGAGDKPEIVVADLARPEGVESVVTAIGGRPVTLLVNNAGFGTYGPHVSIDPAAETSLIAVNCSALVALTRAVLPGMLARRGGHVLNIASTIAFQPGPGQATYGASKAFVLSYTEALAEELRGTGVRVAALCPGATETGFVAELGSPDVVRTRIYRRRDSAALVARHAIRLLESGRTVRVVGMRNALLAQSPRIAPRWLVRRLAGRMLRPPQPPITAVNEITVNASPDEVWRLLADVSGWPRWYRACRWVHDAPRGPLATGATFSWKAHPMVLNSVVTESVPGQRFRFTASAAGLRADHTFSVSLTPDGTRVSSVETQTGALASVGRFVLGPALRRSTQVWLEDLATEAMAAATAESAGRGE